MRMKSKQSSQDAKLKGRHEPPRKEKQMKAIVRTNYDGNKDEQVIDNVTKLVKADNTTVLIMFNDENNRQMTQYVWLDGNTELVLR